MLTPEQIKAQKFRSAGKGLYRSEEVDKFFEETVVAFTKTQENAAELQKTNDELYQRVEALANALNQMRAERELIQKTMILAQKSADELTGKAQEESAKLLRDSKQQSETQRREAREEAERLLNGAQAEVEKLLLEAQAHAENLQAKARARAEKLFDEARSTAQAELVRISSEAEREQQRLAGLQRDSAQLRNALLDFLAKQMTLIEEMPEDDIEIEEEAPALPAKAVRPAPVPEPEPEPEPEEPVPGSPVPEQTFDEVTAEMPETVPADPFDALAAALDDPADTEDGFRFVV